jgi:predicted O-linked N-acetylglucosamine transferase (SPINDLY family)
MRRAVALHQSGDLRAAEEIYREVLRLEPRNADALQLLGLLAHQAGQHQQAVDLISRAIAIRPRAEFFVNLSQAQRGLGQMSDCLESCRRAVEIDPKIPEAWNNLGTTFKDLNRLREARLAFEKALALRPDYVVAINNLGNTLVEQGEAQYGEAMLRRAIQINPSYAEAYSNLAHLLTRLGRLEESVQLCRRAVALKPQLGPAYSNLGTALHAQGLMDAGNEAYRIGAEMDPNNGPLHENLLGCFNHTTRWSAADSKAAHVAWASRFAEPEIEIPPHTNDRSPEKKLRIGYVSPDLRTHSVTYFLEPILRERDRNAFDVIAFSNTQNPDQTTQRLRDMCDGWHDIRAMSDDELAALIRRERIDILIDLAGHTKGNRLPVFGRKPAPVQVTYLGYAGTSGLSRMDYRITDDVTDPPGMTDDHYTEKLIRLQAPFLCYQPPADAPEVAEPPVVKEGFIRFGSFNNAAKIGEETFGLWSRVLTQTANSRLVLKARAMEDPGARNRILDGFARHGITSDRLELIEVGQSLRDHLDAYKVIDIALDTFPYNGTTTTCEALWMGVAVVSRVGNRHVARVGLTLLKSVGLTELSAETDDAFVSTAIAMAGDSPRLSELRRSMRDRMKRSPLTDAAGFTRKFERALREAWRAHCEKP